MIQSDLKRAHIAARYNKEALKKDKNCGCFYCVKVFSPSEIVEWIPEEDDEKLDALLSLLSRYLPQIAEKEGVNVTQLFNGINRQLGWGVQ